MKDKGEIYLLVGEFNGYSARTVQFLLASSDKSELEALKEDLETKVIAIRKKYREIVNTPMGNDVYRHALKDLDQEARTTIAKKFDFQEDAEFSIEVVEFLTVTREEAKNGD